MAQDDSQERTERPTHKRLADARDQGQLARSRELNTAMVLLAAAGAMIMFGQDVIQGLARVMADGLVLGRAEMLDPAALTERLAQTLLAALKALLPLFMLVVLAAIIAPMALSGWAFSPKALNFKWQKLDPVRGLKRVFSVNGLVELVKALVKFALIAGVTVWWLWLNADSFLSLGKQPVAAALGSSAQLLVWSFFVICLSLILIAAVDVPFQLWNHQRQLKMSRQEIKDEQKQTEGNPQVRARIRRVQREMAQRRMMQEVPKADVVVTNPTHFAVALRYDADRMQAPIVVAKGADLVAAEIRGTAARHAVPVVSAPALARAVYYSTELNREIPAGLYLAVAQVLAYVMQLKRGQPAPSSAPIEIGELPIPDELRRE